MRWAVTTNDHGEPAGVGVVVDDEIRCLGGAAQLVDLLAEPGTLERAGQAARRRPATVVPLPQARLGPPLPRPPSIRDFSAFEAHITTVAQGLGVDVPPTWYEAPAFYFGNPAGVVGPDDRVAAPTGSKALDFELEVGIVIGRPFHGGSRDAALAAVAGLVVMNDWSARDIQLTERDLGLGPAKSKDFATSLGPWLVTMDELEPFRAGMSFDLTMTAQVNGTRYSQASLADLYFPIAELVSYAARDTTLVPGDVIGTGTCGTGCILELSLTHGTDAYPWLRPGDVVELAVSGLGTLQNSIVARGDS